MPRQEMREDAAEELRTIFNTPDRHMAETYLAKSVQKYADAILALAYWLEKNIPEGLTVFFFLVSHHWRLRTA